MHKLKIFLLASTVLLAISACTTPEQRQFQEQQRQKALRVEYQQRQASLEARCRAYGFELNSIGFAQCKMKLDQSDQQMAQAQSQRREIESRCELARAQGLAAPTRTGGWGEGLQNGNNAYNACLAGLPPPRSNQVICRREGRDEFYCFSQ